MKEQTIVVIENHYLGSVLDGYQFDTFYHEHPRTYSFTSFSHIAKSLDAKILDIEFPSRYGGNIRVFIGRLPQYSIDSSRIKEIKYREAAFELAFRVLRQNIERWKSAKGMQIYKLVQKYGKLRGKAFPGRAAILVKLLGLDESTISVVYEKPGSLKIGHYLPGTRIEIHSDDELFGLLDQSEPLINLAWHIPKEIRSYLSGYGYDGLIIDILSAQDFL